jgi:hypothetical protein
MDITMQQSLNNVVRFTGWRQNNWIRIVQTEIDSLYLANMKEQARLLEHQLKSALIASKEKNTK